MVDDLDAVVEQGLGQHAEPVQGVHTHSNAVPMLVLGEQHDESFRATHRERVQHVVDPPSTALAI